MPSAGAVCTLLLFFAASSSGQSTPPPQTGTIFRTQTTLVTVPTVVTDSDGQHIWALQADDFTITDNGVPQKVQLDDSPVPPKRAIVIVVQENDDTFLLEDSLDAALIDFLNALPEGEIPIQVVTAGARAKVYQPFLTDRDQVQLQLRKLQPDADSGGPKLLDGVYLASRALVEQYPDRQKIVLLVSGAHDGDSGGRLLNALPANRGAKAKRDRWNSAHTSEEVLQYVEANDVAVDAIEFSRYGVGASDYWKNSGLSTISLNPSSLLFHAGDWLRKDVPRHLAQATGGEVRNVGRKRAVSTGALKIAADFSVAYDLSFHPTDHTPGLHQIRVTTPGRDKLHVRSREFYWAQTESQAVGNRQ